MNYYYCLKHTMLVGILDYGMFHTYETYPIV